MTPIQKTPSMAIWRPSRGSGGDCKLPWRHLRSYALIGDHDSRTSSHRNGLNYGRLYRLKGSRIVVSYFVLFIRRIPRRRWLLLIGIIASFAVGLAAPHLLLGGRRSVIPRFILPVFLAT